MLGKILIDSAFVLSILSTLLYFFAIKKNVSLIKYGKYAYGLMAVVIGAASVYLMYNILTHNYQFYYIWSYSSNELSKYLLITTFFAGQEGSFLLWALMVSLIGFYLSSYAKKNGYEALVMGIYSFLMVFLTLMLIAKSPFDFIWERMADIQPGIMPTNGKGLNPILQNYWNMIHPPILFIGYSAMSVPYVFAIAGLMKKDYRNWINIALPWTLGASSVLGIGLMLGGFWAYETLGWGGFWGWDPVENSSLLPWLVSVALVHTMLVQKRTNGLVKTNFVLSIVSFVLVIYATFLTRSGILSDSSVHSFGEPGTFVYTLLLIFLIVFVLIGIFTLFTKMKDISEVAEKIDFNPSSKEFFLTLGSLAILASTAIIFIGTSMPIFQGILGNAKSTVEGSFYNNWNLPIAFLILITNAISLYLNWKNTDLKTVVKKSSLYFAAALLGTIIIMIFGMHNFGYAALIFSALFSLLINTDFLISSFKKSWRKTGAYLSHIGISFLIIGALSSGAYSTTMTLRLGTNKPVDTLGYKITYLGKTQIDREFLDREKYQHNVQFEKGSSKFVISPVIYLSNYNQRQQPFLEPGIKMRIDGDIYLSPVSAETNLDANAMSLLKTQTEKVPLDSTITITMEQFDMSHETSESGDMGNKMPFGAIVTFTQGTVTQVDTLSTLIDMQSLIGDPVWKTILNSNVQVSFVQLLRNPKSMGLSQAMFLFKEKDKPLPAQEEYFTCEISEKPYINFVWFGSILIAIGFLIAIPKHLTKKNTDKSGANSLEENSNGNA